MFTIYSTYCLYLHLQVLQQLCWLILWHKARIIVLIVWAFLCIFSQFWDFTKKNSFSPLLCCYLIPIPMVPMVHLIKKVTLYARTDVLQTADRRLQVRIRALHRPYCPNEVKARWWYLFSKTIENVSTFWNRCGSHWEEETVISIGYFRKNGVAQRRQRAYATVATGVLQVRVRACYRCG